MPHELPKLEYDYSALEPYIDTQTMEIHHSKHHRGYVDNLNKVLEKYPKLQDKTVEELLMGLNSLEVDKADLKTIQNNGGGHANHSLFWSIMGPVSTRPSRSGPKKQIDHELVKAIETEFGDVNKFKELFEAAAKTRFGSGWAWLVRDSSNKLQVYSTANQDSPLTQGHTPLIGLDVWEHAYYLKYQNKRPDYVAAWWNVLKLM